MFAGTQTRLTTLERRAAQTSSRLAEVEDAVGTLTRGATVAPRNVSGRVQRPSTALAIASGTPGVELATYYPNWIDWPGRWIDGANTAYASFEANILALFAASVPAPGQPPAISRVYIAFMAPNPLLASVVIDFTYNTSTGVATPVYGTNALYVPPGGSNPATSMPFTDATAAATPPGTYWITAIKNTLRTTYSSFPDFRPTFVLSVGGWSYCQITNYFAPFATMTPEQITAWAENATALAASWGYDGIDVDYELPTSVPSNYTAGSILDKVVTALAENMLASLPDYVSVTVAGAYTEVGGGDGSGNGLLKTLSEGSYVRVINLMLYDSGCLTRYDPAAFALQFKEGYDGSGTFGSPALPGINGNKLGFGLEIVPQATSPTIKPYTMDVCVTQTLAAAAVNYGFKEVFLWVCSPPDLSMSTFATYLQYITAGLTASGDQTLNGIIAATALVVDTQYGIISAGTTDFTVLGAASNAAGTMFTATNVGAATGTGTVFAAATKYTVSAVYDLGPLDVRTVNSWVPGDLPPSV